MGGVRRGHEGRGGSAHRMGGAVGGNCLVQTDVVRMSGSARVFSQGSSCPTGGVCFGQGESPVKLFAKLFGKSPREGSDNATARHRAQPDAEGQRPLLQDQVGGPGGDVSGGQGAPSVDPAQSGGIGFGQPSSAGGGFSDRMRPMPPVGSRGRRDPMSALVCTRCGNRNAENSRFCSNCGAPLRRARRRSASCPSTTSTISISGSRGLRRRGHRPDAYADTVSRGAGGRGRAAAGFRAAGRAPRRRTRAAASCWTAI
ncbi:hypothetical protein SPURM210S_01932 [Streptomyces purpurascens]